MISKSRVNWLATIYINFRCLPILQAFRLPIYIYGFISFRSLNGQIRINTRSIHSGMIKIGQCYCRSQGKTRLTNEGTIVFNGVAQILRGAELYVKKGALLSFGREFLLCEDTMIFCYNKILIGDYARITYHSQIFDTDFHFVIDTITKKIFRRSKPVVIGDNNWIGNKTTIKKGVRTPNNFIVAASNSVLTKDYSCLFPENSVVGGNPIRLIGENKKRIYKLENENKLESFFKDNDDYSFLCKEDINKFCEF